MIRPHGGRLVSRYADEKERAAILEMVRHLPALDLNRRETSDAGLIANGAMSPLEGFMTRGQYEGVLDRRRLPLGLPWTIPITLSLKNNAVAGKKPPFRAALRTEDGDVIGVIDVEDIFTVDHTREAERILLTTDAGHPGVQYLQSIPNTYVGGEITVIDKVIDDKRFTNYLLEPKETRVPSRRGDGRRSSRSRRGTPSTGLTSTSRSARSRPSTGFSSTRSRARQRRTTSPPTSG